MTACCPQAHALQGIWSKLCEANIIKPFFILECTHSVTNLAILYRSSTLICADFLQLYRLFCRTHFRAVQKQLTMIMACDLFCPIISVCLLTGG